MADVIIDGQPRRVIHHATEQGSTFVLGRTKGLPELPIEYRTVVQDARQAALPESRALTFDTVDNRTAFCWIVHDKQPQFNGRRP
jgi:glucose dehydrogenase